MTEGKEGRERGGEAKEVKRRESEDDEDME